MNPSLVLNKLFIFNPTFTRSEVHVEEKLVFFHPSREALDVKQDALGFAEGFIQFSKQFCLGPGEITKGRRGPLGKPSLQGESIQAVDCDKTRYVFYEPEPDFWFVLVAGVGSIAESERLDDSVLLSVLHQAYRYFKLFNGSIHAVLGRSSISSLRNLMDVSMQQFIMSIDLTKFGLYDVLDGLHYLPLDRSLFLTCLSFVHNVENRFPAIRSCLLLCFDHIVWSGLSHEDTRAVYRFLIRAMPIGQIRNAVQRDLLQRGAGDRSSAGTASGDGAAGASSYIAGGAGSSITEGYLIGPQDVDDPANTAFNSVRVFLSQSSSSTGASKRSLDQSAAVAADLFATSSPGPEEHVNEQECSLVVYQHGSISMVFFVPRREGVNASLFAAIREFMLPDIRSLSTSILNYYNRSYLASSLGGPGLATGTLGVAGPEFDAATPSTLAASAAQGVAATVAAAGSYMLPDDDVKYIYFNQMNLALKTSLRRRSAILRDVMHRLGVLHRKLTTENVVEVFEHSYAGHWLVARKSGDRILVSVIERSLKLTEVDSEIRRLSESLFSSIFFPMH